MLLIRRIATAIVIAAALAVLVLSVYLLWNARQWDYLPLRNAYTSDLDARSQLFQEKLEIYSRRVNDMEMMVIILLGITGLYTIVFILTLDLNSRSVNRQLKRAIENVSSQIGASVGDLRQVKDETRDALRNEIKQLAERLHDVQEQGRKMMEALRRELADVRDSGPSTEIAPVLEHIERRISTIAAAPAGEEDRHELMHYESALPMLEIFHARRFGPQLAAIYRAASRYYAATDAARARFYLSRAVALSPDDFKTANELGALVMNGVMDGVQPSDYWQAKKYFESSLEKSPNQQRASYGLALLAKADGDLETAQRLLERALKSDVWESGPDAQGTSQVHYALACVLARRGQCQPAGRRASWFLQAMEELDAAFRHPSNQLEQMLSRDTEEGGDLYVLANTSPYGKAVDELLLNVKVGAT